MNSKFFVDDLEQASAPSADLANTEQSHSFWSLLRQHQHRCVSVIDALIVFDTLVTTRQIALVEGPNATFGFFILCPSATEGVLVEQSMPVNSLFQYQIVSSDFSDLSYFASDSDISLVVSTRPDPPPTDYLLHSPPRARSPHSVALNLYSNLHTQNFVANLQHATEVCAGKDDSDFEWLHHYLTGAITQPTLPRSTLIDSNTKISLEESDRVPDPVSQDVTNNPTRKTVTETNRSSQLVFHEQHFAPGVSQQDGYLSSSDDEFEDAGGMNDRRREHLARALIEEREGEYTRLVKYSLFVGTWNVNGQMSNEEVAMKRDFLACDTQPAHFYAVGFQELDLSKETFLRDSLITSDNKRVEQWTALCRRSLPDPQDYFLLKSSRLIGMLLLIFVKTELKPFIKNVVAETVGTGILGKMGNKGGVAIRFDLHETSLCFVNCHLAAHVENYERRNQDYREINSRLQFWQFDPPKRIEDHDQIYWFGDMNYRLMNLNTDQVRQMLCDQHFEHLLESDQLRRQMAAKNCFHNFQEGAIRFQPSYKYNTGTDQWDSSEKRRPPAWCDRVLWKGSDIRQVAYRSHPSLKASDHKPVSSLFDSSFRVIDLKRRSKVYEDVMKKLDKEENDVMPQVKIDTIEINFGSVCFKDNVLRELTLTNIGKNRVKFSFKSKRNYMNLPSSKWLRVTPLSGYVSPKESVKFAFELNFDNPSLAAKLNYGLETLSDTLVLRLRGGKHIFITVSGQYRPSCFGLALNTLALLTEPVSSLSVDDIATRFRDHLPPERPLTKKYSNAADLLIDLSSDPAEAKPLVESGERLFIPKELFAMIDYLHRYGAFCSDLFQSSGLESEFIDIRNALDHCCPANIKQTSVNSVADALLLFLQTLPQPVIPFSFYQRVIHSASSFSNCKQIYNELPEVHRNVFQYIILFLRQFSQLSLKKDLDSQFFAKLFGPILVRKPPAQSDPKGEWPYAPIQPAFSSLGMSSEQMFVFHFLHNDCW